MTKDGKFHGKLTYSDTTETLRISQEWGNGRLQGSTKAFNEEGELIFHAIITDSSHEVIEGPPENFINRYIPRELGKVFLENAQIQVLNANEKTDTIEFQFLNIPEHLLIVTVHKHQLRRGRNCYQIIPKHALTDSITINISTFFDDGLMLERNLVLMNENEAHQQDI